LKHFVIFGQGRTGSTLLVKLLQSHPQVQCDLGNGEILNRALWRKGRRRYLRHLVYQVPTPYIHWKAHRRTRPIYGFKLLYRQVASPRRVLAALHRQGWQIVHIQRSGLFDLALSHCVARATGHYGDDTAAGRDVDTIAIPGDDMSLEMQTRIAIRYGERRVLADLPVIRVTYEEDLLREDERNQICSTIFQALGISSQPVSTSKNKSWNRPYRELIVNYDELQALMETETGRALQAEWGSLFVER
jgi:hypothetical protein